jgi:hypothetical protein
MTNRTIQDIQQEFGRKSARILNGYHDTLDEIKAQRQPKAGATSTTFRASSR